MSVLMQLSLSYKPEVSFSLCKIFWSSPFCLLVSFRNQVIILKSHNLGKIQTV